MIANILMRAVGLLFIVILSVLVWKTTEYFNGIPETSKHKPLLAWDILILFLVLVSLVVKVLKA